MLETKMPARKKEFLERDKQLCEAVLGQITGEEARLIKPYKTFLNEIDEQLAAYDAAGI